MEPYPLILYIHYAGLVIFTAGVIATFRLVDPRWQQRVAYGVAGTGFLMAWGGGHMVTEFTDRELFDVGNVVGFLVLVVAMNVVHRRAALAGGAGHGEGKAGWLRRFGWVEGASLVILLFIAMPLKYIGGIDEAVRYTGMIHGGLFMIFVGWVLLVARQSRWTLEKTLGALVASIIPFGPFVADLAE